MTGSANPVWNRGDPIDAEVLKFTVGDDWMLDRRLIPYDLRGSIAHVGGLCTAGLLTEAERAELVRGLERLLAAHAAGTFTVEEHDEDVHSAVERRLAGEVGELAKKLHTARSRNEQVAVDVLLWLRDAIDATSAAVRDLRAALGACAAKSGRLPIPGYTHLRRAMPSTVEAFLAAHARALELDLADLDHARARAASCPLGSGAGYGVPVDLPRDAVANSLGFADAARPVTHVQHGRGRAELAYLTALESIALDVGKLAEDLWLFSTTEFGFVKLPAAATTGSSLMPQKRNPDVLELTRAHARQLLVDREAVLAVVRDLPSGYHRDFQLLKPPLFRAHDRALAILRVMAHVAPGLEFDAEALARAASDPALLATARVLDRVKAGTPFRDAYRDEAKSSG